MSNHKMPEKPQPYQIHDGQVPESYFDTFEDRVMNRLRQEADRKPAASVYFWPVAASLLILAGVFGVYRGSGSSPGESPAQPDPAELTAYMDEWDLNEEEFEELIPEETIDSVYHAEMITDAAEDAAIELEALEEEYSVLDEETEI